VERQSGRTVKMIRTDGGGNYYSNEFQQMAALYSPQHKGVPRRKNRTSMTIVRSMLKIKKMPYYFWGDVV